MALRLHATIAFSRALKSFPGVPHCVLMILNLTAVGATVLPAASMRAMNIAFMPGDAFFHALLTEDVVMSEPQQDDSLLLMYDYPAPYTIGNFAGFERLTITDTGDARQRLRELYWQFRGLNGKVVRTDIKEDGTRVETELNGFHVFVYAQTFAVQDGLGLGLKYNERWMTLPKDALIMDERVHLPFTGQPAIAYRPFVRTVRATADDWKDGPRCPALPVREAPVVSWGRWGAPIKDPVLVTMKDVQLVVLLEPSIRSYFERRAHCQWAVINADGIENFIWEEGGRVGRPNTNP